MPLIRENAPLAPYTYYKIGGPARYFAQPESLDELGKTADFIREHKARYFILGAGSNVLLDDRGFDGVVISTAKLDRRLAPGAGPNELLVGASVQVIQLLRHCMTRGIGGFELLVGVPGNVGGVLCMNAGTKSGEIEARVAEVTLYDLATKSPRMVPRAEMSYSYRANHFLKPHEVIVHAVLRGVPGEPKQVQDEVTQLLTARKASQPIEKPSCGSVFKNPDPAKGVHAWKLIADAGLRGRRAGNAQISELHTNFIVNLGAATAADVKALIELAKKEVKAQFGFALEEEVRIVPFDGGRTLDSE